MTRKTFNRWTLSVGFLSLFGVIASQFASLIMECDDSVVPDRPPIAGKGEGLPEHMPEVGPEREALEMAHASRTGWYQAEAGDRFDYRIHLHSCSTTALQDGQVLDFEIAIDGTLRQVVLARREQEILVQVSLPACRATVTTGGRTEEDARGQLTGPLASSVIVRMGTDGATLGYQFPADQAPMHRNLIRGLISSLRVIVPESSGIEWQAEELYGADRFMTRYHAERCNAVLLPEELAKTRLARASTSPEEIRYTERAGSGRARLDTALGWPDQIAWHESATGRQDDLGVDIHQAGEATAVLIDHGRDGVLLTGVSWAGPWEPTDSSKDGVEAAQQSEQREFARLLEGVTVDQLLGDLGRALAKPSIDPSEIADLQERLSWIVRLQPDCLDRLRELLLQSGQHQRFCTATLAAIMESDSDAVYDLVAALIADDLQPDNLRVSAVVSAFVAPRANPRLSAELLALASNSAADEGLRRTSLLAVGSLASKEAGGDGQLLATLLDREAEMNRQGTIGSWLLALSNSGQPQAIEHAVAYATHGDAGVRQSAMMALGHCQTEAATKALIAGASQDPIAFVRAAATKALARQATARSLEALAEILGHETDCEVRVAAVEELVVKRSCDAARRLLERVAQMDADERVRERARSALVGRS